MGKLIDDLLQLSRLSRKKLEREDVDITAIAQLVVRAGRDLLRRQREPLAVAEPGDEESSEGSDSGSGLSETASRET